MIYVPTIYMKKGEEKFGAHALGRLSDPRVKPYLRLMMNDQCESPNSFLAGLGLMNSRPFIGIPRVTKPETIESACSKLIQEANSSESDYLEAEIELLTKVLAIVVYDCNSANSEYEDFARKCHKLERPCALYTDHPIDYGVLRKGDYILYNIKQDTYAVEDTIDEIRNVTEANIVLIRENRTIETTNKSLEDGEEIDANGKIIQGDLRQTISDKSLSVFGFGDFCGWKNTVNVKAGRSNQSVKTIALFNRAAGHFKVLKDSEEISLKEKIRNYMAICDPHDATGTIRIMDECIKNVGGPREYNSLSIYHYVQEMLLNDDWSTI